jgi:predicted  nucleic acid-binding Zn-ribbon protein
MAKQVQTVEDKLRAIYDLQLIDSKIDRIRIIRGELPLEVEDLEDEIAGLQTRLTNLEEEAKEIDRQIAEKKNGILDAEGLVKKYTEQQNKVRNNREYDSLNKEIEYQGLEIQLHKKRIKEFGVIKEQKALLLGEAKAKFEERMKDLEIKKSELDEIVAETQREEEILVELASVMREKIEERLLHGYDRIRGASKNGLAVVPIEREASAGSFIKIPPQRQLDVSARKKIIVDEHSGRIIVDKELADEEIERIEKLINNELKKVAAK